MKRFGDSVNDYDLPVWLKENTPELNPDYAIITKNPDGKFVALVVHTETEENDDELMVFENIKDLYLKLQEIDLPAEPDNETVKFLHFSEKEEDSDYCSLYIIKTSYRSQYKSLSGFYKNFLKLVEKYDSDPGSFKNSYNFLHYHPMFWVRLNDVRDVERNDGKILYWDTGFDLNSGRERINVSPSFSCVDDLDYSWRLEFGAHVQEERIPGDMNTTFDSYYYDLLSYTSANSIEEAYIEAAAKVRKYYDLDGNLIESVYSEDEKNTYPFKSFVENDENERTENND